METYAVDRISPLPDSIIHYIFSFLDTRDFVQTSILSSRWRHLWESTPYLKFHQEFYPSAAFTFHQPSSSEFKSSLNVFTDFVDRVLILREAFGIHKFQLFCDEQLEAGHLYTWLLGALRRHAQVICLDLCIDQPLDLPQHLFSSRVSTLEIYNNLFEVPIRMPESMCSTSRIKSLKLVGVELPDGNLQGELVLNCSALEALSLIECDYSHLKLLTISALSLKKLKLHTQYLERLEPCAVQICCPKLVSFELTACMCTNCSITDMSSLDSAYINSCENIENQYDDCLAKVLRGISNVKSLKISTAVVKTITDSPSMLELSSSLFHNLRHLEMIDWATDACIQHVATFLENLPYMEIFVWSRLRKMKLGSWWEGGDVQMNSTLKIIEIQNSVGSEDEVKLLQILLEKSAALERVGIFIGKSFARDIVELEEFHEKLLKLPRASPSVEICFPLKCIQDTHL